MKKITLYFIMLLSFSAFSQVEIVENFDSSVQAVDDYYRTDGIDFNPAVRKSFNLGKIIQ